MQKSFNNGDDQKQGQSPAKAVPPALPPKKPSLAPKKAGASKQLTVAPAPIMETSSTGSTPAVTSKGSSKAKRVSGEFDEFDDTASQADSDQKPLLAPSVPKPAPLRQSASSAKAPLELSGSQSAVRGWTKSPRGSSDAVATAPKMFSSRTKTSIPAAVNRSARTSAATKKESVLAVDPVERVAQSYSTLEKNLREGLGNQISIYDKAMGQIRAGIKALKNVEKNSEKIAETNSARMRTLLSLIPDTTKKTIALKKHDDTHQKTSSDDDHQSAAQNRSSGDSTSPATSSGSSPTEKPAVIHALAVAAIKEGKEQNSNHDEPNSDSPPRAGQPLLEPAQLELPQETPLLPIADFFPTHISRQIIDADNLSLNSPLLVPLNVIISRLQHLKGQFVQNPILKDPLSDLCDYYINARQQLIDAKTKQQKEQIFEQKAVAVSDRFGYVELAPGKYESSAARGRKLVRTKKDGSLDMENKLGRNPGGVDSGAYMKVAKSGEALDPLAEQYAQNTIGLYNQNTELQTHTASTGIQILRAPIDQIDEADPDLKQKLRHYGEHDKAEAYVQCGDLVQGDDFLFILEAQATFVSWTNTIPHDVLQTHFAALEKLSKDNPQAFSDISNWPPELIRNPKFKIDRAEALPTYFKLYLQLVPVFTVENALKTIPFLLDNIDSYAFTALFYTQLILDPLDVTAGNLKRCEKPNPLSGISEKLRWLRAIDADRCLGHAITQSGGLSYIQIKCFLHVMTRELDRKVDPQWVKEFLSLTPLQWLSKSEEQTYRRIHQPNARLLEECILTETVLFDQTAEAKVVPAESNSNAKVPVPRNTNTKPKAVGIPFTRNINRLTLEMERATRAQQALENNPEMTHEELFKIMSPEVYILYKRLCLDKIRKGELGNKDNYADALLKAFDQLLFQTPSYEVVLMDFSQTIIPTLRQHGKKGAFGQDYGTAKAYMTLVKEVNTPNTPKENHLKTMEQLTYECMIPELGYSLGKLLENYRVSPDEENKRKLTSPESIKLFYDRQIEPYLPEDNDGIIDLLETIGSKFEDIKFELHWLKKRDCAALLSEAIAQAKPAAVKILAKGHVNINGFNVNGETGLHSLLRTHRERQTTTATVLKTLELCLSISTCEPETEDARHLTPVMAFIDAMDIKDQKFAEDVFSTLRKRNVNLNQRTEKGTALDLAIDRNNVTAFIALINQGAGDCVDINTALQFIDKNKGKKDFDKAVEMLLVRNPDIAYEIALAQISTTKPDNSHPEHCCIKGPTGPRYVLEEIWNTLINPKTGEPLREKGVKEGQHIVRPIKMPNSVKPLLFAKFYPDMPGLQRLAELFFALIGCPTTRSDLWRVDRHNKKSVLEEAIPMLLVTALHGEPLKDILSDPAKLRVYKEKLDHDRFTLMSTFLMLIAQEDGHQDQFIVIKYQTPDGEKMLPVPADLDRILVTAYRRKGEEMFLLLKDIMMFMEEYRQIRLTPQTIATILFANGKRFSTKDPLTNQAIPQEELERKIRENYHRLFDKLTSYIPKIEQQHLALFPCDGSIPTVAVTGKQALKYLKSLKAKAAGAIDGLVTEELIADAKLLEADDQTSAMKLLNFAKKKGGTITIVGLPLGKDNIPVFFEHSIHTALVVHRSGGLMTPQKLLSHIRPDTYRHVKGVIAANPKSGPIEHYAIFTKGFTNTTKGDVVARTSTSLNAFLRVVSDPISGKRQSEDDYVTAKEVIIAYEKAKQAASAKAIARSEISKGDTTSLQRCNTLEEFEALANNIKWDPRGKDNRAIIDTMIKTQRENNFTRRKKIRIVECKQFTFDDLIALLELSPYLEELELTGSTFTEGRGLGKKDLFLLLVERCPNSIQKVIINKTTVGPVTIKGHLLPRLTHFEARECPKMPVVTIINSNLEHLDILGSNECEHLNIEYTADQALIRPMEEERPLKTFNIRGCTKLSGADITGVLDRSPFLNNFIHGGNQEFSARSFGWFAFEQRRFNRRIFESMIQNGKLNLHGLPFEDRHLAQFQVWLGVANAPKVTEVNDRGCCKTTRLGMVDFVFRQQDVTRLVYGGPVRGKRSCGGISEWNMGLKNPIASISTLSTGAIAAFSRRTKGGAVEYTIRMPDDSAKDLHSSSYNKEVNAKPDTKPSSLLPGFDLVSKIGMSDGTLLLSLQEDPSQKSSSSFLMILDPITRTTRPFDIPEVTSYCGYLCMLNPTTFALHSDRLYIIQKEEMSWRVKYSVPGTRYDFEPISNGKDLVAFSTAKNTNCTLSLMNYHTGDIIYSQEMRNCTMKPVLFLGEDRIVYYDNEFYSVLNFSTFDFTKLEKHSRTNITDPKLAWAIYLPTGELRFGGGNNTEVYNPSTLSRFFTDYYPDWKMGKFVIAHNGDEFFLNEEGKLYRHPKRFFIMDLSFRLKPQPGYECLKVQDQNNDLTILTPETLVVDKNHIDENGNNWIEEMLAGKPTCTTFAQMIRGLLEKFDLYSEKHGHKPSVTFDQHAIHITGLSDEEVSKLRGLLNIFWKKQANLFAFHAHRPEQLLSQQQSVADFLDEDNTQFNSEVVAELK